MPGREKNEVSDPKNCAARHFSAKKCLGERKLRSQIQKMIPPGTFQRKNALRKRSLRSVIQKVVSQGTYTAKPQQLKHKMSAVTAGILDFVCCMGCFPKRLDLLSRFRIRIRYICQGDVKSCLPLLLVCRNSHPV